MTLQQLKYIVILEEERHFARAAEKCMVSQPGLTIQLKKLEEEIGVVIFDRSKVPLVPTTLGWDIIRMAQRLLHDAQRITDYIIESKNVLEGTIHMGVVATIAPYLVPLIIDKVSSAMPKVNFTIQEDSTVGLMESLLNGKIDIALMATPTGNKNLKEYPVFNEQFVAYLNPSHSMFDADQVEVTSKMKTELLLLKEEFCFNAQLLNICGLKKDPNIRRFNFDITSIETLKNLVRADQGYTILPQLSIDAESDRRYVKRFKEPVPVREISLVVTEHFSKKLILEKLNSAIWDSLPKRMKEISSFKKIRWDDSLYFRKALEKYP